MLQLNFSNHKVLQKDPYFYISSSVSTIEPVYIQGYFTSWTRIQEAYLYPDPKHCIFLSTHLSPSTLSTHLPFYLLSFLFLSIFSFSSIIMFMASFSTHLHFFLFPFLLIIFNCLIFLIFLLL